MKTIAFYSYKGGTSRSLLVANYARYLARCGKSVAVLDFDLEAPGLHHKFLDSGDLQKPEWEKKKGRAGLQQYLLIFDKAGQAPSNLREYFLPLEFKDAQRPCYFMPAGDAPTPQYASNHLKLDWKKYFPQKEKNNPAYGVNLFLNLRNRIETDLDADFLLIDSRTGITDIGTAAVAFMPNVTVCLFLCNTESLAGTHLMLKTIHDVNNKFERSIETLPVLTRVPDETPQDEDKAINRAQKELKPFLDSKPLLILREDPSLLVYEELLVGSEKALLDSTLLRDYFLLFYALDKETAEKSKYNKFRDILEKDRHKTATTSPKNPSQIDMFQSIKCRSEKVLLHAGRYKGNTPSTLTDRNTYNERYIQIKNSHEYGYSDGEQYEEFASRVLKMLLNQIHQCDPSILPYEKPVREKDINWDLLGLQVGNNLDFCSELYYLTKYRGLFVDIVQLGWIKTFTCFLKKDSTVHKAIIGSNHQQKIQNAIAAAKKALENNKHNNMKLEVCLMGESAAADVAVRSISPMVSGDSLMFERDAVGLWRWISEDNENYINNRIVVCDHSVAIKMKFLCEHSKYAFSENSDSIKELVFSVGENDRIPTGFLYPIGDSKWRYMINRAVAEVILETPEIWEGSENALGVSYDLRKSGIIPFTRDELITHLVMGMNPEDATEWLEKLHKKLDETDRSRKEQTKWPLQ